MTKSPENPNNLSSRPKTPASDILVTRLAEYWLQNYCQEYAGYDIWRGPDFPAISPVILPDLVARKVIEISTSN